MARSYVQCSECRIHVDRRDATPLSRGRGCHWICKWCRAARERAERAVDATMRQFQEGLAYHMGARKPVLGYL